MSNQRKRFFRPIPPLVAVKVLAVVTAATLLAGVTRATATVADFTWSGSAAPGVSEWSNSSNWEGAAPSGTVGTLTFPALTAGACTAEPPTATCYESHNDVSGISANALSIDDGAGYFIDGSGITLGAGGLTSETSVSGFGGTPELALPITLGVSQKWLINGSNESHQIGLAGAVTGTSHALEIELPEGGSIDLDGEFGPGSIEAGSVTVRGRGEIATFSGNLNGTDANPVGLAEEAGIIFSGESTVGPLTLTDSHINGTFIGRAGEDAGVLHVNGGVTFDSNSAFDTNINEAGTVPGTDYSQLSASGAVDLAGARLYIGGAVFAPGTGIACASLSPGDVYPLIATTGSLTGTFQGVPDGSIVSLDCFGGSGTSATVRVNYTAHEVTATVLAGGGGGTPTTTALAVSNSTPAIGESVTYTATVTPEALMGTAPSGTIQFRDGGEPIGSCSAQPLTQGAFSSTATCTLSYSSAGAHEIVGSYGGDVHYAGSSSSVHIVTVQEASSGGGGTTGGGTTSGGTTGASTPGTGTAVGGPSGGGSLALRGGSSLKVGGGTVKLKLKCAGSGRCRGKATLTTTGSNAFRIQLDRQVRRAHAKPLVIGAQRFSIAGRASGTVRIHLSAAGKSLLRRNHGKLKARLTIAGTASGHAIKESKIVRLKAR